MDKKLFITYEIEGVDAKDVIYPSRRTDKHAGYSLHTYENFILEAKGSKVIDTGIMLNEELPGMLGLIVGLGEGEVIVRSHVLTSADVNTPIRLMLHNPYDFGIHFEEREPIAQIIFMQCFFDESEKKDA